MFLYVHQSYGHDSAYPCLLRSWEALWDPLVCSYDISHSGTQQVTITSLAASTVSWIFAPPSINWACGCLTSVIGPLMVAPCQRGYFNHVV